MTSTITLNSAFALTSVPDSPADDTSTKYLATLCPISRSSTSSTVFTLSSAAATTLVGDHDKHCEEVCLDCGTTVRPLPVVSDLHDLPSSGSDILVKPLVAKLRGHLTAQLEGQPAPRLLGLLATDDAGCRAYAAATAKTCESSGINFETHPVRHDYEAVRSAILALNAEVSISGLIVYFPIFGPDIDNQLRRLISPRIDVEGVHPVNLATSASAPPRVAGEDDLAVHPCTSLAVVRILQDQGLYDLTRRPGQRLRGKVATVVNRSETVGKPLAIMLANEGAMVFSVDINGVQVYERHSERLCIRSILSPDAAQDYCFGVSDVIVSAVPSARFKVPTASIKPGAACVNVATDDNFEGDVKRRARLYARRVGSVTTMMLQMNAVCLQRKNGA